MKKALLIGINNYATQNDLRGCLNDVDDMRGLLADVFQYDEFATLKDAQADKAAVLAAFRATFAPVPGEDDGARLFYFAGHGGRVFDAPDGDEGRDRVDENICLPRYQAHDPSTYVLDDEFAQLLAEAHRAAPRLRLYVVLDSCHSGTGTRAVSGTGWEAVDSLCSSSFGLCQPLNHTWADTDLRLPLMAVARQADDPPGLSELLERSDSDRIDRSAFGRESRGEPATHLLLSGCTDLQTCKDVPLGGKYRGIFTHTLARLARSHPSLNWTDLRAQTEQVIQPGFMQNPQLEGPAAMKALPIFR